LINKTNNQQSAVARVIVCYFCSTRLTRSFVRWSKKFTKQCSGLHIQNFDRCCLHNLWWL